MGRVRDRAGVVAMHERGKPQSMQMQIKGLGMAGEQDVEEVRKWIAENPDAYAYMVDNAIRLSRKGYVSANYLVNMVRNELHVAIKNGHAPALARIMAKTVPCLEHAFRMHESQSDGYV